MQHRSKVALATILGLGALALALATAPSPPARAQDTATAARTTQTSASTPVEASLESMQGGERSLAAERGRRVVVLFYEDRPHVEDNDVLKGELLRFVADNGLASRVVLYGVANLADVGGVPRMLVREMIRPLVERWGSDILLDWDGVMRRPPFSFQTAAANVAVIDRDGRIAWHHVGSVDGPQRRELYRALRVALATP
jgi:hypothetical protein